MAMLALGGVAAVCTSGPAWLAVIVALAIGMTLGMASARRRTELDEASASQAPAEAVASIGRLLEQCEDAIAVTDLALGIVYANEAFAKLCGRAVPPRSGTTITEALRQGVANAEDFAARMDALSAAPRAEDAGEITHVGTLARPVAWRSIPLCDRDGSVQARGFVFQDRSQAQELAGLKSDFLSTVTHELRTPLTSVKGSLQLVLSKSTALSPIDSELLHISLKNTDRLIRLINDLLDISRLELGKIELTFGPVSTASLVEEAVAGLRAYASGRDIAIACEVGPAVPPLQGDRDRLIQVLTNLISNAVKFSPAGGRVLVSAEQRGRDVAIAVRDWGIGIPTGDQSRLFQRFQRLNHSRSDEPGTGLGLAISKAIIERHGGRITLVSCEHAGSTFTILVPAVLDAGADDRSAPGRDDLPTVLLVDGDAEIGGTLAATWAGQYRLTCVHRGAEALDAARRARPQLILLAQVLPDVSGYDVLRVLQTTTATAGIPVVMLAAEPERALATSLGASDVIRKPLDLEVLDRTVQQVLDGRVAPLPERRATGS